ncbi:MAG: cadherin-like domain-containing protein [Anaerolineales bacterium]|nr:cadherin-like domain-containing protein [Anaerolineales bacterium]
MKTKPDKLTASILVVVFGLLSAGCSLPGLISSVATPTTLPTLTPFGSIEGTLWHDECVNGEQSVVPEGCVGTIPGSYQADGILDPEEKGIPGGLIDLGEGACPSTGFRSVETDALGFYHFDQLLPGVYCVSVDRSSAVNAMKDPGIWTYPINASNTGNGIQTVVVGPDEQKTNINFGWDYLMQPVVPEAVSTPTQEPLPTATQAVPVCLNRAAFITDVTVPDGYEAEPGSSLTKTWRIKNTGTCTWNDDYDLVFTSGTSMGSPTALSIGATVKPGETIDVGVRLTLPSQEGTYIGNWKLRADDHSIFGFGDDGSATIWTRVVVQDEPPEDVWRGSYFDNPDLNGSPALVREDEKINFDWGSGSPASSVPSNRFSVRWERRMNLSESEYRIRVVADDGVRLYVDDQLVLDRWEKGTAREFTLVLWLDKGEHEFRMEYFEYDGKAEVEFKMTRRGSIHIENWRAVYWPNRTLSGDLAVVQDDAALDFDWEDESAVEGFPVDNFSARWEQEIEFTEGVYTFFARSDDGIRVWIDGKLLIDKWVTSDGTKVYEAKKTLSGVHTIRVEYFEKTGNARISVWWEMQEEVNAAPVSQPDSWTLSEDVALQTVTPGVLANDSDADGTALTAVLVSDVQHGTLVLAADGSFLYTPAADFYGSDTFTYKASDGVLFSDVVTVTLQIQTVNDTPQAVSDGVQVWAGQTVEISVLDNDTGLGDTPIILSADVSAKGVLVVVSGSKVQYSAPTGASGSDSFSYEIRDTDGEVSSAVVLVVILDPGG